MRSRIGVTWRCTYFLLANGCVTRFTRFGSSPSQKSFGRGEGRGSRSLALWVAPALAELEEETLLVCCANAVSANRTTTSSNMRYFISTFPRVELDSPLQPEWACCVRLDCAPWRRNLQGPCAIPGCL